MALNLPPLFEGVELVKDDRSATLVYQKWWQQVISELKKMFASQQDQITAIAAANAAAAAANAAAVTAQSAAVAATTAAADAQDQSNLVNSYPTGLTLSAVDAGANTTITVSAHTRVYADGTSVSVAGGTLTGLGYTTTYFVYYDDVTRAGGTVTYVATTSSTTAAQINNRHLVGSILTPAALAGGTTGKSVQPPGVGAIP